MGNRITWWIKYRIESGSQYPLESTKSWTRPGAAGEVLGGTKKVEGHALMSGYLLRTPPGKREGVKGMKLHAISSQTLSGLSKLGSTRKKNLQKNQRDSRVAPKKRRGNYEKS